MIASMEVFDHKKTFVQTIIDNCKLFGNRTAFIDANSGESISFNDLLRKSIKLSKVLTEMDFKKDDIAAICMDNNIHYPIIFMACLFNGIALHCINPKSTIFEFERFLGMSKPMVIFTYDFTYPIISLIKEKFNLIHIIINSTNIVNCVNLKEIFNAEEEFIDFSPVTIEPKEQVALIMNSSGTTGTSKAVEMTHENLTNLINFYGIPRFISCDVDDVSIAVCPFYHLYGIIIFVNTLLTGIVNVVMTKFKKDTYLKLIESYKATVLFIVPPIATLLVKSSITDNYNLSSVKAVFSCAAPLAGDVQDTLNKKLNVTIQQLYGMTEMSGVVTAFPNDTSGHKKAGCVGILIPGLLGMVKDLNGNTALGPNQPGELCFKGKFIMKGYLNNSAATSMMFNDNSFLMTGDLGYYDEDGYFYVIDRLKELIKHKGFQVAPAELEDIINSHPGVSDCAVVGKPDEIAGELPIAFVVKQLNCDVSEQDIKDHVALHVSNEKQIHGGVRFLEEIPKTESGKILRKNLRLLVS
ncbi:PREDICTED: 4-coumarate--CoA ligase 1-like [Nicrophorus vespilloides]|uniref:4-coumarate--CoA ligase 1-like n=1 Tax=Nicrophorus vespilloides TaxID=110193 RepID=A0ABM1MNM6_NICVS|nr:PREDICTED: 4-coumarate--CoA ligase 1-like [Nicrophorus vespilloides]